MSLIIKPTSSPSFFNGYATHGASQAPGLWKDTVLAHAPFLGRQGNKLVDFSGFDNHGTINGATWVPGNNGPALSFGGGTEYVSFGIDQRYLDVSGSFSVGCLFRASPTIPSQGLVGKHTGGPTGRGWWIKISLERVRFTLVNSVGSVYGDIHPSTIYADEKWHYVVAIWSFLSKMELFVDGVLVGTDTTFSGSLPTSSPDGQIGRNDGRTMVGEIESVVGLNRPLSHPEAIQLSRSPYSMFDYPVSPGIMGVSTATGLSMPVAMQSYRRLRS